MEWTERVKGIRRSVGMTMEELSRELGVTLSSIWKWESGYCTPSRLARRRIEEFEAKLKKGAVK